MPSIIFYKHVRKDGGVRIGVETDDATALHEFHPGRKESDPVMLWYVDVRCEGPNLPTEPQEVRDWLLRYAPIIRPGIMQAAEELKSGIDYDADPWQRDVGPGPEGSQMVITCSAARRQASLNLARELTKLATNWEKIVRQLPAFAHS